MSGFELLRKVLRYANLWTTRHDAPTIAAVLREAVALDDETIEISGLAAFVLQEFSNRTGFAVRRVLRHAIVIAMELQLAGKQITELVWSSIEEDRPVDEADLSLELVAFELGERHGVRELTLHFEGSSGDDVRDLKAHFGLSNNGEVGELFVKLLALAMRANRNNASLCYRSANALVPLGRHLPEEYLRFASNPGPAIKIGSLAAKDYEELREFASAFGISEKLVLVTAMDILCALVDLRGTFTFRHDGQWYILSPDVPRQAGTAVPITVSEKTRDRLKEIGRYLNIPDPLDALWFGIRCVVRSAECYRQRIPFGIAASGGLQPVRIDWPEQPELQ